MLGPYPPMTWRDAVPDVYAVDLARIKRVMSGIKYIFPVTVMVLAAAVLLVRSYRFEIASQFVPSFETSNMMVATNVPVDCTVTQSYPFPSSAAALFNVKSVCPLAVTSVAMIFDGLLRILLGG